MFDVLELSDTGQLWHAGRASVQRVDCSAGEGRHEDVFQSG